MLVKITPKLAIELLTIIALNGNIMSDECREFKKKLEEIRKGGE